MIKKAVHVEMKKFFPSSESTIILVTQFAQNDNNSLLQHQSLFFFR